MSCRVPRFPSPLARIWLAALLLMLPPVFFTHVPPALAAESATDLSDAGDSSALLYQFGKVIFAKNSEAPNQIYIIGQNHRSPVTGANDDKTLQAQMEIYRIGEWLIRQRQIDLLLPEGFFGDCSKDAIPRSLGSGTAATEGRLPEDLDEPSLRERLADTGTFVNAAILLNGRYGVSLGQVEDEGLYREVAGTFRQMDSREGGVDVNLLARMSCVQEQRTAAMLQNIPAVVEHEHQDGHIRNKQAIFLIGMAHIAEVIRFLEQERIELAPFGDDSAPPEPCAVALLEKDYGVTVILPRTLAEDTRIMRLTRLVEFAGE